MMKVSPKRKVIFLVFVFLSMVLLSWHCESNEVMTDFDKSTNKVYEYAKVSVKPELIKKGMPSYPEEARKKQLTGEVIVTVTIDEQGNVSKAELYKALNDNIEVETSEDGTKITEKINSSDELTSLDQAALDAAKKCKFKPAQYDGKNVSVSLNIPYKFALK